MTRFSAQTPLIDAMMAEEAFLERVIAYRPMLAKFQPVLNDERVAQELRLADVARMLDLSLETLMALGEGAAPPETPAETPAAGGDALASGWVEPGEDRATLDLRPVFERGIEPLAMILDEVSRLRPEATFIIDAPFHPLPLRRLLGGRGFESRARQLSGDHWQVAFRRQGGRS